MGEVIAHKRQPVDRLRRRLDHYRRHHNACLPRYEQSADGLFEKNKQETLVLKQRFLESKAKKVKTSKNSGNEHHKHAVVRDSVSDAQKILSHPKPAKRPREHSPVISMPSEVSTDDSDRSTKTVKPSSYETNPSSERHYKKPSSLSQQQFTTNCNNSRAKTHEFSPKANSIKLLDSCAGQPSETKDVLDPSQPDGSTTLPLKNQPEASAITTNTQSEASTISCDLVPNALECKKEKEQRNDSTLCQFQEDSINYSETLQTNQDRLSDTFPSIGGLAEDSCDGVLHPDILKDLFDDVFTNSPDMMDFFDDSVGSIKVGEDEDIMNKNTVTKSLPYQSAVDKLAFSISHPVEAPQPTGLFTDSLTRVSATLTSTKTAFSTIPSAPVSASKVYNHSNQQCLPPFNGLSSSHQLQDNLSIDFKLTEPSPAALTLKQMAEQHQNMQQKQQLGRNLDSSNRMAFSVDPFPDPVSVSFRNRFFLNESNNTSKSSNSPISLFNSPALVLEQKYPDVEPLSVFKEKSCSERLLEGQQRSLMMRSSGHSEQKSPCVPSGRLGWTLEAIDHSNTATHPMDGQYLTVDNRQANVNENHMLGIGFGSRAMQQVKAANSNIRQQKEVPQQQYSNMYNMYPPQYSDASSSMFSGPVPQSVPYNTQFTPTVGRLPPEYKLDQSHPMPIVEQTTIQTPATYQQTYMRHQPVHNQSLNNQWRHVLPQNNLNVEDYQRHDGYRQLSSQSNQIASTTVHHNVSYPYSGSSEHGHVSRPNLPAVSNQPMMQHRHQLNSQFQQRQQLSVEHRLVSAMNGQTLGTENTSHISATSTTVYNITQDNSHINLDFLENINSNTSDLLNFDQVLHGETGTTYQLMG